MNFQEKLKQIRELVGLDENVKSLLEKMTGKELVSYEGIDALVAALMGFYNVELKKKAQSSHTHGWGDVTGKPGSFPPSSHTHDDRYYTESEINEKFKNFCPYAVGDVYVTTSTTNPATRWTGTTWQKIEGRFLLGTSGSGASKATGGSNSKTIAQANLPNVKLTVNSFSVTSKDTFIESLRGVLGSPSSSRGPISMPKIGENNTKLRTGASNGSDEGIFIKQNQSSEISGTVSPQTSALGSGSALNITPAYYTCHMWLRLT